MEDQKKSEFDCSRKCKNGLDDCEASGQGRDECEDRYNQCVSSCAFA